MPKSLKFVFWLLLIGMAFYLYEPSAQLEAQSRYLYLSVLLIVVIVGFSLVFLSPYGGDAITLSADMLFYYPSFMMRLMSTQGVLDQLITDPYASADPETRKICLQMRAWQKFAEKYKSDNKRRFKSVAESKAVDEKWHRAELALAGFDYRLWMIQKEWQGIYELSLWVANCLERLCESTLASLGPSYAERLDNVQSSFDSAKEMWCQGLSARHDFLNLLAELKEDLIFLSAYPGFHQATQVLHGEDAAVLAERCFALFNAIARGVDFRENDLQAELEAFLEG